MDTRRFLTVNEIGINDFFCLFINTRKVTVQLEFGQQISIKDTLMLLNISQVALVSPSTRKGC